MKKQLLLALGMFSIAAVIASFSFNPIFFPQPNTPEMEMQSDNKVLWKQVDSLIGQGLPKSALELVNKIYMNAETTADWPEFVKASLYQLRLRSDFEENFIEKYIGETEKNLLLKPEPARQILHSMLADLYWQYYQQNRYRILDQTVLSVNSSEDMATWDARRFVEKTSQHYHASLNNTMLLQSISLKLYDPILQTAEGSKKFRPTLYDFLAHRAIDFFMNDEASITKPIQQFVMRDSNLLETPEVFTELAIVTADTLSFHYQAITILQQVENFHQNEKDAVPLMDATLKRLDFVKNNGNIVNSDTLYLHTLLSLEKKYEGQPVSADVMEKIARFWYGSDFVAEDSPNAPANNNYVTARNWCLKAIEQFPESEGAMSCEAMLNSIEARSLTITLNGEVVPAKPFPFLLDFRNTPQVWFRLIKLDYDKNENLKQNLYNERSLDKYLNMKPIMEWNISLPLLQDYRQHSVEVIHPAVEAGYYLLLASGDEHFNRNQSPVTLQDFWVSSISYIRRRNDDGSGIFYVLDRSTGEPLQNVKAQIFTREYDYKTRSNIRKNGEVYTSGANGSFLVKSASEKNYASLSFDFSLKNERLVAENYFNRYSENRRDRGEKVRTFLFTDRSIYRPGQTVYFKGIVTGNEDDNNRLVTDHSSTITLYDVNGQKVSSLEVTTNKFGSFSGSFVLPASGLGGQFRIDNGSGNAYFNVEEYKRPKFEVEFLPITGSYRLNERITLSGKAESYTGVPVTDAAVSYRVVRSVSWPFFRYGWGFWPYHLPESEIANGTLVTQSDGTFQVEFTALPDPKASSNMSPLFRYKVYAYVSDINGETRSALTTVNVSSKALMLDLATPATINRDEEGEYKLTATNLSGEKTPAKVTVEVFSLKENTRITRRRNWNAPDTTIYMRDEFISQLPADVYLNDDKEADVKDKSVYKNTFNTAIDSLISFPEKGKWAPGRYLITLNATDAFGEKVSMDKELVVFAPSAKKIPVKQAFWGHLLTPEVKAGSTIQLLAGTAVKKANIQFEVMIQEKSVHQEWIKLSQTQRMLTFKVPETYTGNIKLSLNLVYDNRSYHFDANVNIPDTKHQLSIAFESFRSPLLPGGSEKWKLKITGPDNQPLNAELLAGMYDASLDAFAPHNWNFNVSGKYYANPEWETRQAFTTATGYSLPWQRQEKHITPPRSYDALNWFGYYINNRFGNFRGARTLGLMNKSEVYSEQERAEMPAPKADAMLVDAEVGQAAAEVSEEKKPETAQIRRNLQETAFFMPQLTTNAEGELWVEFTVPEALTRWNFMGLAHTEGLRYGQFSKEVVTRKELMITPNLPRFFREGDKMTLQTKVSSLATNPIQGNARLELFDAISMKPVDAPMKNASPNQSFELEAGGNTVVSWEIQIPEGLEAVMVRITAMAGNHSDGEEVMLPVLTNRMMVTETLPLPINGKETKNFTFDKLVNQAGGSTTLRNHRLTLEFTSNPAWYAVQALPYLAEKTSENSDQVFNRLYANSLASFIANSSPKIRAVFETWQKLTPDALLSNLEKNQELKALVLEETPWLMEARNESEQKQRIAVMFDLNRMAAEQKSAGRKLQQLQSVNGGWPWFEGMPESRYITQLIVTGFGRMHYLKVSDLKTDDASLQMIQKAASYLNMRLVEDYDRVMKDHPKDFEKLQPGQGQIQYLFAMSYLKDVVKTDAKSDKAVAYFGGQARKFWTNQSLYTQGMIALWAGRSGDMKTANAILKSMRERALVHPEMGMYWRDNSGGYFWYQAPVETQALLIELFEELGNDPKAVDQMKTWLLKQKQTQSWATSRATADAVYALLLRGGDWLQTESGVKITLGSKNIEPKALDASVEAGSAYFKTSWTGSEITPEMGKINLSKSTQGPAWGALYWQYFEDIDKVTSHDSPLKISKKLYIKTNTDAGPVLKEITADNPLKIGQQVTVRLEIRTDRDLEYVHLKDMRAAGFEPINTLSGYRWNGGMGYYENTRDASTNFFFNYLAKGTWVFEYSIVASQKGEFSNGLSSIQCMYAPEFAAHSEGIRVSIK
jgi:hypothetical protein